MTAACDIGLLFHQTELSCILGGLLRRTESGLGPPAGPDVRRAFDLCPLKRALLTAVSGIAPGACNVC